MKQIQSTLLIDDDSVFNFINEKTINQACFAINTKVYVSASKAFNALVEVVNKDPKHFPDVIFLDINMPGMDGWEFLDKYKDLPESLTKKCHVYILSSSINPDDIAKSKTYTVVDEYISKPLDLKKLAELKQKLRSIHNN